MNPPGKIFFSLLGIPAKRCKMGLEREGREKEKERAVRPARPILGKETFAARHGPSKREIHFFFFFFQSITGSDLLTARLVLLEECSEPLWVH